MKQRVTDFSLHSDPHEKSQLPIEEKKKTTLQLRN